MIKTCCFAMVSLALCVAATAMSMRPIPDDLNTLVSAGKKNSFFDRFGRRMNITYENRWNRYEVATYHDVPGFLRRAFVLSEDKRFFSHHGVDWMARANAARQNIMAGRVVRGASTISEQVVRMLHPRPRTFWSRWIEGIEAMALERKYCKIDILEFYLNQVPYKGKRRGIVQAARYYFDRDISTLNQKEMLTLAVLVRSPKWFDPETEIVNLERAIGQLMVRMHATREEVLAVERSALDLKRGRIGFDLSHFIRYANSNMAGQHHHGHGVHTTIDMELQARAQKILDNHLERLEKNNVQNGAALVVDHETCEILAWVVGHAGKTGKQFNHFDPILVRRQPGSTLKPFLYAKAMEKGWTAATMIDDAPLAEGVGLGMHAYRNYSRRHYGLISLRESMGNSLNIPAVKTIQYVGTEAFLSFLHDLGIESLAGHPNVYGDGLALGNGEITLYELVQAYAVMARMGAFKPLSFVEGKHRGNGGYRAVPSDIASLIADILSDPGAREKEFGWDSLLNLPYQTAVKTGTSSGFRDAWAAGYNDKFTVGVWMGNLDYSEMKAVTGSSGPALVLRTLFNELNRNRAVRPIYLSDKLVKQRICIETGGPAGKDCESRDEWFVPGTGPNTNGDKGKDVRIRKPSQGLMLAMDPRIPDEKEYFEFAVTDVVDLKEVKWFVNNELVAKTEKPTYNWKVSRGDFVAMAEILFKNSCQRAVTEKVQYRVN